MTDFLYKTFSQDKSLLSSFGPPLLPNFLQKPWKGLEILSANHFKSSMLPHHTSSTMRYQLCGSEIENLPDKDNLNAIYNEKRKGGTSLINVWDLRAMKKGLANGALRKRPGCVILTWWRCCLASILVESLELCDKRLLFLFWPENLALATKNVFGWEHKHFPPGWGLVKYRRVSTSWSVTIFSWRENRV